MSSTPGIVYGKTVDVSVIDNNDPTSLNLTTDHIIVVIDAQLDPYIKEKVTRYLNDVEERFLVKFSVVKVDCLRSQKSITPQSFEYYCKKNMQ